MEAAESTGALLPALIEALEARERTLQAERARGESRQRRRAQRVMDLHERQCREVDELRQCLQLVADHSRSLEGAVRAAGTTGGAPLGAALLRQAADLRGRMLLCVRDAAAVRDALSLSHRPHMDALLHKMESELCRWTEFVNRASRALVNSSALLDNVRNLAELQRRTVADVSRCPALASPPASPPACSTPRPRD